MLNSLHVDDLNSWAHTIGEALEFFVKCKEGLALGGFNLRKFRSNSKGLENLVVEKFHEEKSNENKYSVCSGIKGLTKLFMMLIKYAKIFQRSLQNVQLFNF